MITTKNISREELPPMLREYASIKDKYPNDIIMFRVGDFFESYFEDAVILSSVCGLRFTAKRIGSKNKEEKDEKNLNLYSDKEEKLTTDEIMNSKVLIPMAGVPHKALGGYAQQLIYAGHRVVVVEQMEDPKTVKGRNVRREVIAILSSMNKEGEYLTEYLNNFLCIIVPYNNKYSLCFADITTSDIYVTTVDDLEGVYNEISRYKPSEIVVNSNMASLLGDSIETKLKLKVMLTVENSVYDLTDGDTKILDSFNIKVANEIGCQNIGELASLVVLINYVDYTQKLEFSFGKLPKCYNYDSYMDIDSSSRLNLELTENVNDKTRKGSLLSILDNCKTSMGSRKLKQWIDKPLQSKSKIEYRLEGVDELVRNPDKLENLQNSMFGILDISRIMGRLKMNKSIPRDLVNLRDSLIKIPNIKNNVKDFKSPVFLKIFKNMGVFDEIVKLLEDSLLDDPVSDIKDGLVLRPGYNQSLDEARDMIENSNKYLNDLEERERIKTGIKSLKVVNKNGKCAIEVNKGYYDKVPEEYRIEKALKASTRYVTDESEKLEKDLFSAIERSKSIEIELYEEIKEKVINQYHEITLLCEVLASLDALCSLSNVAINQHYVKPEINTDGFIDIKEGRHPVVEKMQGEFVSNDTYMDKSENQFILITGPNMAGKSTYMRQIALITLMAHMGSFVPAKYANISIVDKIFTRIGASDDISSGRSTYMVEMTEVKNILDNATNKSLVLLDEVGRGTSTSDGLAIAQSITEYIHKNIGCKTLFATHYHELISLEEQLKGLKNYHMSVNRENGSLDFVRKIEPGGLSESYGIDVAQLAGLPTEVIERARTVLDKIDGRIGKQLEDGIQSPQSVQKGTTGVEDILKGLDSNTLNPSSAYTILCGLIKLVK